jgi:hypothetical protein
MPFGALVACIDAVVRCRCSVLTMRIPLAVVARAGLRVWRFRCAHLAAVAV